MSSNRGLPVAMACMAAAMTACGEPTSDSGRHMDELAPLGYTEELRIGSVEDPDFGFSEVRQVRVSDRGDVFVLDAMSRDVRVFDSDGELLRVIGGPGEGPGEFASPVSMGLLGDTLWVADVRNRRIIWFSADGELLWTTPTLGATVESGVRGVTLTVVPSRPLPDGFIESDRAIMVGSDREIRPYRYPVVLFNRDGEVVDTVRWETADENAVSFRVGGRQGYAPVLRPARPVDIAAPDGRVIVDWSVPENTTDGTMTIVRLDSAGDTAYSTDLRYTAVPVPSSVLDSLVTPMLVVAGSMGATERELESALRSAIQLPTHRPPVRTVRAGADGSVWLQLNAPDDDAADWTVVASNGQPRGRVRLPARMQIHHSALPTVWVVELDEFDVPWLVRLSVDQERQP